MKTPKIDRRRFLEAGAVLGAAAVTGCMDGDPAPEGDDVAAAAAAEPFYRISLAEWSYFRELFGPGLSALGDGSFRDDPSVLYQGELDHLDFPARARSHGIEAVEYVNTFFFDRAR
ncbi:MAG: twin-arginine translocation signal domain-containing protein, partial [Acidobacteria bacterium]|nr:twin-arginine translocation signal domain-containing protein [Acidobacteriota bacterium]